MSKNLIPIFLLTLIAIAVFVAFQIFKWQSSSTIPQPTQKQMEELDPTLDKGVLEELKLAPK
jgi:LPS O-antigen subunit length determinant protein (WzzB/FepE family)